MKHTCGKDGDAGAVTPLDGHCGECDRQGITIEEAVKLLVQRLRLFPWFITIGIDCPPSPTPASIIHVYVKRKKPKELVFLDNGWYGYEVCIHVTGGSVKPIASAA